MNSTRFQNGFSQEFSDVVARAASNLQPLTNKDDTAFLQRMLLMTVEAFWNNYIVSLPQADQEEFLRIEADGTDAQMADWHRAHINLADNMEQLALATKVMDEIDAKLPAIMKQEYENFTKSSTQAL